MFYFNLMFIILLLFKDFVIYVYFNMILFSDLNKIEKKIIKKFVCFLYRL